MAERGTRCASVVDFESGQNGHFLLYAKEKLPYAIERDRLEARRRYGVLDSQHGMTGAHIAGEDYSISDIYSVKGHAMSSTSEIEFFFDCSSPWTYLAFHNIQHLAASLGTRIRWRPFMVGGVFNIVNPAIYASRQHEVPVKAAYGKKNLNDWARWSGVEINFPPSVFPVNSAKVMRACLVLDREGRLPQFARAAYEAYFRDDIDISQDFGVRAVCAAANVDADVLLAAIAEPAVKDKLRANGDELIRRGGFGSPTLFVGGDDMYFGNDALPLVRAALLRLRN